MEEIKRYHRATEEEVKQEEVCEEYDLLVGPNGFSCCLTEPEDRRWYRDGQPVVDELNKLDAALARKDAMLRELADAALRAVNCEYGCGGCFRTCIFDKANTVRDLADAARKEAGG